MPENEIFRSSDMALVVYLKQNGHSVQNFYYDDDNDTVYWTFYTVPSLLELVEAFGSGAALVEPREYNRLFQLTKREMYSQADPHR